MFVVEREIGETVRIANISYMSLNGDESGWT